MIREMSFDLLRHELTDEQEAERIEQTRVAVEQCSRIEDTLEQEAGRLVAHGDYLQHRISAARQLNRYVGSEDLQAYVSDFIDAYCHGAQLVRTADGEPPVWEIDLGPAVRAEFAEFLKRERMQERSRLVSPASGRQRCIFENVLRRSRSDAESISQYHPLIAFIRERLNAEERHRHAVLAALRISGKEMGDLEGGVHVFAVCRWSISGEQDSERLAFEVLKLEDERSLAPDDAERLVTGAVLNGKPWTEAPGQLPGDTVGDGFEAVMDRLETRYTEYTARAGRENRDRVAFQLDQIERQERREIEQLEELVARLRGQGKLRTIKANEGRIAKVRERAAERRARLQLRKELRHDSALVCAGVVMIE
jgi:hypothetical protein